MLKITVPSREYYDQVNEVFINVKEQTLLLEHSLLSISKWESKWKKPFLSSDSKSNEEILDYIRCMNIGTDHEEIIYYGLSIDNIKSIEEYINDSMTATWFNDKNVNSKKVNKEVITSEIIYYWMIALNIPMECQKWHLNRLLTLIRVCNIKNSSSKNMNKKDLRQYNRSLNAARKQKFNTTG